MERFKSEMEESRKIRIRGNELGIFIKRAKDEIGVRSNFDYYYQYPQPEAWEPGTSEAWPTAHRDFREVAVFAKKPIEESEKIRLFKEFKENDPMWRRVSDSEIEVLFRIVGEILREMMICPKCGKEMTFPAGERRYCMEDITAEELDAIIALLERRLKRQEEKPGGATCDDFGDPDIRPDRPLVNVGSLIDGWKELLKDLKRKRELLKANTP